MKLSAAELAGVAPKVAKRGRKAVVHLAEPEEAQQLKNRATRSRYKTERRDKVNEANRASYRRNKATRVAGVARWRKANPERYKQLNRLRMRKRRQNEQQS